MTTPKIHISPSDASGSPDAIISKQILDYLPNKVDSISQADAVIVPVIFMNGFRFNERLLDVPAGKVCLLDYLEFGWSWGDAENRLGHDILKTCGHLNTPEYAKLDEWVKGQPPRLTFKRELLASQKSESMLPIEFLCTEPAKRQHTKEEFDARVFSIFNCFGLSHPMRFQLHAEIFQGAHKYGYNVVDKWGMEKFLEKRNFVSIYSPWQVRKNLEEVMRWQRRAKISVSLPGAGVKCFRTGESCCDCIMALPYDNLAWAYPFEHGVNCIRLRPDYMLVDLVEATQRDSLYEIYLGSLTIADKYRSQRYVTEYLMPAITARI